jgi:hypothetical protein
VSRPRRTDLLDSLFASVRQDAAKRKATNVWHNKAGALRSVLRPHQKRLEADNSPRIAVRSARQVGKSTAAMLIAAIRCLEKAQSDWVVIGLTRPSVKRIYWSSLQKLNEAYELGLRFQFQELTATFPNGSRIFFVGGDNWSEIEKLRGGRYHGAIVDECKSFPLAIFEALLQDVLEPALMGQAGQLYLIGTPGDQLVGEFYLATCEPPHRRGERWSNKPYDGESIRTEDMALWSFHRWTLRDNDVPFTDPKTGLIFTLWDKALEIKASRGWGDDHATWRREYLGDWVSADGRLVYRYRPAVHDYVPCSDTRWGLPDHVAKLELKTVVGFDFGSRDGTAIVVWAYPATPPTLMDRSDLWEVYSEKRVAAPGQKLTVRDIAEWYREVEAEYGPFEGWPADWAGLATLVMDTLADEHGVFLEPADKKEKNDHIELFNNDLDAGRIHIRRGSELSKEMLVNRWLDKNILKSANGNYEVLLTDKRKEDPGTPNDLCDAGLYSFRWCRHRHAKPATPGAPMFTTQWWAQVAAADLKRAEDQARASRAPAELDRAWWSPDDR